MRFGLFGGGRVGMNTASSSVSARIARNTASVVPNALIGSFSLSRSSATTIPNRLSVPFARARRRSRRSSSAARFGISSDSSR